jgi:death on curing protein
MIHYLTAEQVLFIHARLVAETGGAHGVRDIGLLLSAVERPQATFGEQDLYPSLYSKAAALLESLVKNHPFIDGNKRTAITSAGLFLKLNGYRLIADNQQFAAFTLQCAQGALHFEQMTAWFEVRTEKASF